MQHPHLIAAPGVVQLDSVPCAEDYPILKVKSAHLDELAREFAPFTTGLLHTHGGLKTDPVKEFVFSHPDTACDVAQRDFDVQLFSGVARDPTEEYWDRRLFFIERKFWPELLRFLQGVTLVDSVKKTYSEAWPHVVPTGMRPDKPVAFVTVFGVRGSVPGVGLRLPTGGLGLPALYTLPPVKRLQRTANAVFKLGPEALAGS
jgi:hypothetical protein